MVLQWQNNPAPVLVEERTECHINNNIDELNKKSTTIKGSRITLTNNEIKDIIKVSRSLGTLLKGTTGKITSQKGGLLNFLNPVMRIGLPLMKNVLTPLPKSVLVPLQLKPAPLATTVAAIQKEIFGSGTSALIILNEEMDNIMIIVKYLEGSSLLAKGVSETISNEVDFLTCY